MSAKGHTSNVAGVRTYLRVYLAAQVIILPEANEDVGVDDEHVEEVTAHETEHAEDDAVVPDTVNTTGDAADRVSAVPSTNKAEVDADIRRKAGALVDRAENSSAARANEVHRRRYTGR